MSTRDKDYIAAGTINWITQTSFDPPMVAMAVDLESDLQETIEKSREFTLHLLAEGQADLLVKFSDDSVITENAINGFPYKRGKDEQIVLEDSLGYIICEVTEGIRAGDHTLYLATVKHEEMLNRNLQPLTTQKVDIQYA